MKIFRQKIKREISKPTTIYTIIFVYLIKFFIKLFEKIIYFFRKIFKPKKVIFAYDLEIDPLTFDFFWFLALCECNRIKINAKEVEIYIYVPENLESIYESNLYHSTSSMKKKNIRFQNLIINSLKSMSANYKPVIFKSQVSFRLKYFLNSNNFFPGTKLFPEKLNYFTLLKNQKCNNFSFLRPPNKYLNEIVNWLSKNCKSRKVISLTLRNSKYQEFRNSNLESWSSLSNLLIKKKFEVLILIDPESSISDEFYKEKFKKCKILPLKFISNPNYRLAIYRSCYFNVGVSTGPMGLCYLSNSPFLQFKSLSNDHDSVSKDHLKKIGYDLIDNEFFLGKNQKIIWNFNENPYYMYEKINENLPN